MRTSPGPVKTKIQCDSEDMYVDDAFRTLVGLIEKSSTSASSDSGGEQARKHQRQRRASVQARH